MKALALTTMLATLLGLVMLTLNILMVTVRVPAGMMNPVIHLELVPGTRDEFLACLLATIIAAYFYAVVAWIDGKLHRLRAEVLGDTVESHLVQPPEVQQLKNAIRRGDLPAIRHCMTESALAFTDERFMTPLELAELYGREDVILAVRKAVQRKTGARFVISAQPPALPVEGGATTGAT